MFAGRRKPTRASAAEIVGENVLVESYTALNQAVGRWRETSQIAPEQADFDATARGGALASASNCENAWTEHGSQSVASRGSTRVH